MDKVIRRLRKGRSIEEEVQKCVKGIRILLKGSCGELRGSKGC